MGKSAFQVGREQGLRELERFLVDSEKNARAMLERQNNADTPENERVSEYERGVLAGACVANQTILKFIMVRTGRNPDNSLQLVTGGQRIVGPDGTPL